MNCDCLHCEWTRKKDPRAYTDFFVDWLLDNIHYANGKWILAPINNDLPHSAENDVSNFRPSRSPLTADELADIIDANERQELAQGYTGHARGLVHPLCHISPKCSGVEWTKVYEHQLQVGWRPIHLKQYAPPIPGGQRFSLQLSGRARCRLLAACLALGRHYPRPTFMTLTYKETLCQLEAKRHFDVFWKRVKYHTGHTDFVWVAELQKRGVIHYHIMCPGYIEKEWVESNWMSVDPLCGWTHIVSLDKPAAYMAKYLRKDSRPEPIVGRRWSCSRQVSEWCKPLIQGSRSMEWEEFYSQEWSHEWKFSEHSKTRPLRPQELVPGIENLDCYKLLKK